MERVAYVLTIREGMEEDYRNAHRNVWPALIETARRCGVRNHSSFVNGRSVFIYMEAEDLSKTYALLAGESVKNDWNKFMANVLEPGEVLLEEVFHMD